MKFFIGNSRLVFLIILSIMILGIRGLLNLNRESIPPVDFARATITTVYPGSSPVEVEELVTNKIEDEIRSTEGLKDVVSLSQDSLSSILIFIDIDGRETKDVITELHRSMQNANNLPDEILDPPRLIHIDATKAEAMLYLYVTGPNKDRGKEKIAFQLKTLIEKIPGISEVTLKNYGKREFQILLSEEKMNKYHISLTDVTKAVKAQTVNIPAGYLESKRQRHLVRLIGKPELAKELENIVVRSNFSGQKVLINDVGQVVDGIEKELTRQYFYQEEKGKPFTLSPSTSIEIRKSNQTDTLSLISKIQNILRQFEKTMDSNYNIHTFHSEGEKISLRLTAVINNALIGLFFVLIVFLFFLPSRIGLMASLSLPLSILATFSFLPFMGVTFNVITMLAFVICIGMLIDNSVVITEYHSRLLEESNITAKEASFVTVQKFWKPITATILTTIAAFLPMLVTTGVMGEFIKWIPLIVTAALLMSLFESFFLLPNRLQWLSFHPPGKHQTAILNFLKTAERKFEIFIRKTLSRKYLTFSVVGLFFISAIVINQLGNKLDLFATRSPEFYTAYLEAPPNTPLSIRDNQAKNIAKQFYKVIGKENIRRMTVEINNKNGQILASIKPSALRKLSYKKVLENLRKTDKGNLKTLRFGIAAPGPPRGKPLKAVIQSNNRKEIKNLIDEIYPEAEKIPGILNLEIDPDPQTGKEYRIELDKVALSRLGLNTLAAGQALRTALEGLLITEVRDQGESFYIRVKYDEKELSSLKALKRIRLREPFGRLVPLSQVARIVETNSEPDRKKYNFQPALILQAEIDEKKTTSFEVNKAVKKIIEKKISKYPTLSYKLIGQQEATQESLKSISHAMIIAIFAILIILIILFKSFLLSFLILSCIPLGLIGVSWAFFLHQRPISFFALIGIVGLSGVVVNSAIILISYIEQLKKENPSWPLREVMVTASKLRLKPILITNLTTLGGLFPTAYGIAGYEPLLMPMTLALFWGLFAATLLTLVWIPCSFLIIEEGKEFVRIFFKKIFRIES